MGFFESLKTKLSRRSVPVMKVMDLDYVGKVNSIRMLPSCRDRPNSILDPWNGPGWEKDPEFGPIDITDDKGITTKRWIVNEAGKTCGLYTRLSAFPNREKIQGNASTIDDIAEAMGIHPSMRDKAIFWLIGSLMGVFLFAPMLQGILS